ncbi:MAG: ATP synthase F1 subunit gamma [SAR324 cluster bacterium]|nr:ATP synthase F1 subunit gamma [SAR324 cluster bacterium]
MPSLKEIRTRISSVKSTQKTTSAMKMVSAAKLKRAENAIHAALPYSQKMRQVVSTLSSNFSEETHPLFRKAEGNRTAIILITSDRGLCGGYNVNLCKNLAGYIQQERLTDYQFYVIGRKGRDYFRKQGTFKKTFMGISPADQYSVVQDIFSDCLNAFENRQIDRVVLAYNHFVSTVTQKPVITELLPIMPPADELQDERETVFEPSLAEILDTLLKKYVENQIFVAWLDTIAGEHAARMMAMDSATKNAAEMIGKLQLFYNRSRQAAITKELIEIISGAESL